MLTTLIESTEGSEAVRTMHGADGFIELITLLLIFVLVLALTLWTTRWIARYQKGNKGSSNIEVVETSSIGNGRYIQIVKLAETYVAIAVCKDSITLLTQIPKGQIVFPEEGSKTPLNFKELLQRAKTGYHGKDDTKVEDSLKEE